MASEQQSTSPPERAQSTAQKERLHGRWVKAQNPAQRGWFGTNPRTEKRAGMVIHYDIEIPLRDGIKVFADIYLPSPAPSSSSTSPVAYPTILNYSVYGKAHAIPTCMFPPTSGLDSSRYSNEYQFEAADPVWWCARGYAVVFVDARGGFSGEGDKSWFGRGVGEDGYDIVEFLAKQDWANGKVGMYGASAFAMVQWLVAAEKPPSLAAIMPFDGMTDLYREMSRKGGMPETQFTKLYPMFFNWGNELVEDSVSPGFDHPFFDEYWQSKIPRLENITCPAYVVCGWGDHGIHTRGTLNGWEKIQSKEKYLEIHQYQKWEWALTEESLSRQKAFFDKFLLDSTTEVDHWPRIRYAMRERLYVGEWRHASSYPFENTTYTPFYPTPSGGLSLTAQPAETSKSYEASTGESAFDLPLQQGFEFGGQAKLRLWVSTEGEGADNLDLFVTFRKIDAQGNEVFFPFMTVMVDGPIAFGWLRASRRELDETQSTPSKPVHLHARDLLLKPGEVVPVDIEIHPTACRFRAGERLRIVISGHDYHNYPPFVPVARHGDTVNKGRHVVHFGGAYDSHLLLPVVKPVSFAAVGTARVVKWSIAAKRVSGWTDEKFLGEYTGVHAEMTKAIGVMVPVLRNYTQVIAAGMPPVVGIGKSAGWDCNTTLGWSSLASIQASFHDPGYKASAGKHVFTDPEVMGSLAQMYAEMTFDPIAYEQRKDGVQVFTYLPKSSSFSVEDLESDLNSRFESLVKVGAGTGLLRYVLNRDITPADPKAFFEGTTFVDGVWGTIAATEQYWFADIAAAMDFFANKDSIAEFERLPASFAGDNIHVITGKENVVISKDLGF